MVESFPEPDELADRLGLSKRRLYVYLEFLKDSEIAIQDYKNPE